ncbi:sigma-54-dependent transcriptional regulator [Frigidibacter sp. ROC022]|uniref:sigma-54-dependent transcriptional regulator n=1 Tax=Frigidibacter sp. ROC022 TaxID=2971796 RepID=UPI00215ABC09|nr:sigma-54 dependent transcriptional regulator [Frigidibacter sp. ROC022]MCR8725563.1 sigma-54 dependent transcriptional regulator [Frigidibacter sp. ROC022]
MTRMVLVVDDDPAVREAIGQTLDLAGLTPLLAGSFVEAKDHIHADFDGVILSDIRMPGRDGFHLLAYAQEVDCDLPVILLTGEGDVPQAVRGMSSGAFDFLEKPCAPKDLVAVVEKARKTRALVLENRRLRRQIESGDAAERMLVGDSPAAQELRARARAAARSGAEVLVSGPPGGGTAKVAEVIHLLSGAAARSFAKYSAAALLPETLDAAFEQAQGGTLFIDEVAALSPPTQFALLAALESQPGARVIAGTYRDLGAEAEAGRFNPDLFYRLDLLRVRIPALSERPGDIPILFRHFVATACEQAALPEPEITPQVIARLMAQDWPGNSRSLMNAAMRFAMGLPDAPTPDDRLGLAEQMAQIERSLLVAALQRAGGHASAAAEALRLPRKTFYDKLARYGLRADTFRDSD